MTTYQRHVLVVCADTDTDPHCTKNYNGGPKVTCGNCGRRVPVVLRDTEYAKGVKFVGRHRMRMDIQDADHYQELLKAGRITGDEV